MARKPKVSRRSFLAGAAGAGGGLWFGDRALAGTKPPGWTQSFEPGSTTPRYAPRDRPAKGETVHEFEMELTISVHEIVPGVKIHAFTYNGTYPGPELRVPEGDWVLVRFTNRTPEFHTIHWHGIMVPCEMDGVPLGTQWPVGPNQTFNYLFRAQPAGTHFYHCHNMTTLHVQAGMFGAIIVEPKQDPVQKAFPYEREYTLLLSEVDTTLVERQMEEMLRQMSVMDRMTRSPKLMKEMNGRMMGWFADKKAFQKAVESGYVPPYASSRAQRRKMPEFNFFMINGKSYPMTDELMIRSGENIRVRLAGAGAMPHFIHLHGHDFWHVCQDGAPLASPIRLNTIPIFPGTTSDIIIQGTNPGMWHLHDHSDLSSTNNGEFPGGMMTMLMYEDAAKHGVKVPRHRLGELMKRAALAALLALAPLEARANPAQHVPIPEEPSLAPQLEIDAVGVGTLKGGNSEGKGRGSIDFSDSSILVGGSQRLLDNGLGSLVLGGTVPNEADAGGTSFFLHQAFVDYQSERWELEVGRTDELMARLVDLPTLRNDDLLSLANLLNPYSHSGLSEEQQYANVAQAILNQSQTTYELAFVEHLLGDLTSTSINAFGAAFGRVAPPGLEGFERFPEWAAGYRHVNTPGDGLHQLELAGVMNLNESLVAHWDLRAVELITLGPRVTSFSDASDVAQARSNVITAALRYRSGSPTDWQLGFTGGYRTFFDVPGAASVGGALTILKRLGQGFDAAFQYLGQWRDAALASIESPGIRYEQSVELGLVFNFEATINSHLLPRRRLLNIQHTYLPN